MNPTTETLDLTHFDVRRIPCRVKHAQIFQRWSELPVGSHFVLINDHDPVPLYYQFSALFPQAFTWEYLVEGPEVFHVKITRTAPSASVVPPGPPRKSGSADAASPETLDARGLEPPEPMLRTLSAVESLARGAKLRVLTDRQPVHLFPELAARGVTYSSGATSDGGWITLVTKA